MRTFPELIDEAINRDAVRRPQSRYAAGEARLTIDKELTDMVKLGALDKQVGGDHYKNYVIQPIEFSMKNDLNACQHSAIKYIVRKKGNRAKRLEDIDKAIHFLQIYREMIERGDAE